MDIALNNDDGRPVQLKEVAARQGISESYLEQIAIFLKRESLIKGVSGRYGGYLISKNPEDIRVGDIIEAALGPINVVDCVLDPEACNRSEFCECRDIYTRINDRIAEVLDDFTLADIVKSRKKYSRKLSAQESCTDCSQRDLCSSNFGK